MRLNIKYWLAGIIALLVILVAGMYIHQKNHFNKNATINNVAVGGLTAKQAYNKVKGTTQATKVYVNNNLVYQTAPLKAEFSAGDEGKFDKALQNQFTLFPSHKAHNLSIKPDNFNEHSLDSAKVAVTKKVNQLNAGRKAPVDAYAVYQNDKVTVISAKKGNKYNLSAALKQLDQQAGNNKINLTLRYQQPLKANSATVKEEEQQLKKLVNKKVTYQVQDKKYDLTSNQIITKATYTDGKYHYDTAALNKQVKEINNKQATLGKPF